MTEGDKQFRLFALCVFQYIIIIIFFAIIIISPKFFNFANFFKIKLDETFSVVSYIGFRRGDIFIRLVGAAGKEEGDARRLGGNGL